MNADSNFLTYVKNHIDTATDRDLTEVRNLSEATLNMRRFNGHLVKCYNAFFLTALDIAMSVEDGDKTVHKVQLPDMKVQNPSNIKEVTLHPVAISPGDLQRLAAYGTLCEDLHERTGKFFRYRDEQVRRSDGLGVCTTAVLEISGVKFKG